MPMERKASVICCGLFRFSRGPKPSSGNTPSGSGKCASRATAASSRRFLTVFQLLPPPHVEPDPGELHLRYGGDGRELYLGDPDELLRFERLEELLAQRQEHGRVARRVLQLSSRELSRPVAPLLGLVRRLVQVALRHRPQAIGGAVVPAVEDLRREHRVEDGRDTDAVQLLQELVVELRIVKHLYRAVLQNLPQGGYAPDLEEVYDEGLLGDRELEEARPAVSGGEARGLGVRADGLGGFEGRGDTGQVIRVGYEGVGCRFFFHFWILAGRT